MTRPTCLRKLDTLSARFFKGDNICDILKGCKNDFGRFISLETVSITLNVSCPERLFNRIIVYFSTKI